MRGITDEEAELLTRCIDRGIIDRVIAIEIDHPGYVDEPYINPRYDVIAPRLVKEGRLVVMTSPAIRGGWYWITTKAGLQALSLHVASKVFGGITK